MPVQGTLVTLVTMLTHSENILTHLYILNVECSVEVWHRVSHRFQLSVAKVSALAMSRLPHNLHCVL